MIASPMFGERGQPGTNITMDGMTPQLSQLLQEYQDMQAAKATPQGMQARMYGRQGD